MTVNPGFGGQSLISSTLQKIERLAELREQHGYAYLISVDGGVNLDTVGEIAQRKADIAVCGSAFFGAPDRAAFIQAMKERAQA